MHLSTHVVVPGRSGPPSPQTRSCVTVAHQVGCCSMTSQLRRETVCAGITPMRVVWLSDHVERECISWISLTTSQTEEGSDMPDRCSTRRPFTVAACMRCSAEPQPLIVGLLRGAISRCRHGILVETPCLLGKLTCATRYPRRGPMLRLMPCTVDRVPTAAAVWIGPIDTEADAKEVCRWVASGQWDHANLPARLRAELNLARAGHQN